MEFYNGCYRNHILFKHYGLFCMITYFIIIGAIKIRKITFGKWVRLIKFRTLIGSEIEQSN